MVIKKKHIQVVFFSSSIISVVLVSTLIGYNLYIQWKNDRNLSRYRNSIYRLTAEMFKKEIAITNVNVRRAEEEPFSGVPLFEGSLNNNSSKTITSILVETTFRRPDGSIVHKDHFYPLGAPESAGPLFSGRGRTRNFLLPGEAISFRHFLRSCPREVISQLLTKEKFAKKDAVDEMKFDYSIAGVSVL